MSPKITSCTRFTLSSHPGYYEIRFSPSGDKRDKAREFVDKKLPQFLTTTEERLKDAGGEFVTGGQVGGGGEQGCQDEEIIIFFFFSGDFQHCFFIMLFPVKFGEAPKNCVPWVFGLQKTSSNPASVTSLKFLREIQTGQDRFSFFLFFFGASWYYPAGLLNLKA